MPRFSQPLPRLTISIWFQNDFTLALKKQESHKNQFHLLKKYFSVITIDYINLREIRFFFFPFSSGSTTLSFIPSLDLLFSICHSSFPHFIFFPLAIQSLRAYNIFHLYLLTLLSANKPTGFLALLFRHSSSLQSALFPCKNRVLSVINVRPFFFILLRRRKKIVNVDFSYRYSVKRRYLLPL